MASKECFTLDDAGNKQDAPIHNPILKAGKKSELAADNKQLLVDFAADLLNLSPDLLDKTI